MHGKVTFFGTLRIGNYNQRRRTFTTKAQRHKDGHSTIFLKGPQRVFFNCIGLDNNFNYSRLCAYSVSSVVKVVNRRV